MLAIYISLTSAYASAFVVLESRIFSFLNACSSIALTFYLSISYSAFSFIPSSLIEVSEIILTTFGGLLFPDSSSLLSLSILFFVFQSSWILDEYGVGVIKIVSALVNEFTELFTLLLFSLFFFFFD